MFPRREWLFLLLIGLVTALAIGGGLFYFYKPRNLSIAVGGPSGNDDSQLVAGIARRLVSESAPFRFRTIAVATPAEAAAMMERNEVDLAIVRQDLPVPKNGQAIAILHRNPITLIAVEASGVKQLADLVGKKVAAIGRNDINKGLLGELLPHYGIARDAVEIVSVAPTEVAEALEAGSISAVMLAGPPTGRATTEVIASLSRKPELELVFIPFKNAEAIAKRAPAFEAVEIDAGSFGGNPPRPAKAIPTLQFSTFLVAKASMSDKLAADIARNLFYLRPGLAIDLPSANRIEAPDTAKDAIMPVHSGAAAYFDGEEKDLFDQMSEWFYLALFGGGMVASAFASLRRFAAPAGGVRDEELFRRLRKLIEDVKTASSEDDLMAYELELNEIFVIVLSKAEKNTLEDAQLNALSISIEHMRRIVDGRRSRLEKASRGDAAGSASMLTQNSS